VAGMCRDKTVCVSEAIRQRLVKEYGYREDRTVTIWNGVDAARFGCDDGGRIEEMRHNRNVRAEGPTIVCVARLDRQKRIDVLLEAFAIVVREHPACTCVIVGTGPLEGELRAQCGELGLDASVRFVGYVDDVVPYLAAGDVFVLSSENEGLPLAMLEAMACGLPCVATDVGGNREAVVDGETGILTEPASAPELARAIDYMLRHEGERLRMGRNGERRVREWFVLEESMKRVKEALIGEVE
jgi:glycosyltransferase involved in cell wall biosynthesis